MSKNSYAQEARKKSLLGNITKELETKGDIKNTAIETLKDVVVGAVAGGAAGSAFGRFSLIVGAAVTGLGHYYKNRLATVFGLGMMSSTGYQAGQLAMKGTPKEGLEGVIEGAKERVMSFKDALQEKLFLDKVLKPKEKKSESTNGVGDVQYFTYPEDKELEGASEKELDLTALERLERQVVESGAEFVERKQMSGNHPAQEMGEIDPSEQNY